VRWLGQQAEALGVEIFPGFPAAEVLYNEDGSVKGVATGNMGISKEASPPRTSSSAWSCTPSTRSSPKARAATWASRSSPSTSSTRQGPAKLRHRPQGTVGNRPGQAQARPGGAHGRLAAGPATYGGSFLYHMEDNKVAVGFVVGLDYTNPWLSPFEEFQRFKTHPEIRAYFEGGKRIGYGAARSPPAACCRCRRPCSRAARWSAATPAT
jgi:electron-transferring-flavoprotein dehydrogenase